MEKRIWCQMISLAAVCSLLIILLAGCHGVPVAAADLYGNEEVQSTEASLKGSSSLTEGTGQTSAQTPEAAGALSQTEELPSESSSEGDTPWVEGQQPEAAGDQKDVPGQIQGSSPDQALDSVPGETPASAIIPEPVSGETPVSTQIPEPSPAELPIVTPVPTELPTPTPQPAEKTDFALTVTVDEEKPKAGSTLIYHVVVENTGDCDIKNLELQPSFAEAAGKGSWEADSGLTIYEGENIAVLELLERGCTREFLYYLEIPEEQTASIAAVFAAKACTKAQPDGTASWIKKEVELETGITPLLIQFTVKKTADRSQAAPGDTIVYQICIRNTGERALHSVLTTERFQIEGIEAHFLEKEGVLLNGTATQALISKIEPGEAVGLLAEVTLPGEIAVQELINEVAVVTKETGEEVYRSEASVQVVHPEKTATLNSAADSASQAQRASTQPKTSDAYDPEMWTGLFLAAAAALTGIFWGVKEKRKH